MKRIKYKEIISSPYFAVYLATPIAILSILWSLSHHAILNYADAESHLNIAKRVTGSLTPGLSQVGGIWLPLTHILMAPLAINEYLYRTGLAGSIVSSLAFIFASYHIFALTKRITRSTRAAQIAILIVIFNPNILYLATTPLDELVMFASAAASLNFLFSWLLDDNLYGLIFAAFFAFLATLTRYDGWALVLAEIVIVWIHSYIHGRSTKKAEGTTLMFGMLSFFGIGLWLLWNKLIFGSFLYFANSQYSSKTQQMWFYNRGYLPTYNNLWESIIYYAVDTWSILGPVIVILSLIGLSIFIYSYIKKKNFSIDNLMPLLLFYPFLFYTAALYMGQASIMLPQFGKPWDQWDISNVRYGIQMAIPLAVFSGIFISKLRKKWMTLLVIILILGQSLFFVGTGQVISYQDGVIGLSSEALAEGPDAPPVQEWLKKNYTSGLVLMDDYHRPISPVASGIPMQSFINVGNKPYWQESINNPASIPEWVILQKADTDSVWTGITNKQILYDYFATVYVSGNIWVYKRRDIPQGLGFIQKRGQNLIEDNKPFSFYGSNIYDILTMPFPQTKTLLDEAHSQGITVIRFWGFNKEGLMTLENFQHLDYILNIGRQDNIHFIITLGNNWNDYGGTVHFTTSSSTDNFYTDPVSQELFEMEIKEVVSHNNSLNGIPYKDDPTILSWEILNEPRLESDTTGQAIDKWVQLMGETILQNDTHHLVSVGTEGFIIRNSNLPYYENHGTDFASTCSLSVIDICTAHLYPKYFTDKPSDKELDNIIGTWQTISQQIHKPFYLGEIGYDLTNEKFTQDPDDEQLFFGRVKSVLERKQLTGGLLWNVGMLPDNSFTLGINDPTDMKIISNWTLNQ